MSIFFRYAVLFQSLAVFLLSVPCRPSSAAELWVSPGGNDIGNNCQSNLNPCQTVQHAMDIAGNNDTIGLVQGTYLENIVITDKSVTGLTVRGGYTCPGGVCSHTADPSLTVIDGGGGGSVLAIQSITNAIRARFEYLTVRNAGSGSGLTATGAAGAPSHITVADSVISYNTTPLRGGGALVEGNDITLELIRSSVHHNSAGNGGGLALVCETFASGSTNTRLLIRQQSAVQNNTASSDGGGISMQSSTSNCRAEVLIEDSTIGTADVLNPANNPAPNTSTFDGGGVAASMSGGTGELTVRRSVINGNLGARYGSGVDAFVNNGSSLDIEMTESFLTWNGSGAVVVGGAMYAGAYTGGNLWLRILDSTVSGNNAASVGGIFVNSQAYASLDIERNWMFWNGGTATSSVFDMQAHSGGTMLATFRGNNILGNGAGIEMTSANSGSLADLFIENTYLTNHTGGRGLFIAANGGTTVVSVLNSTITENGGSSPTGSGISIGGSDAAQGLIRNSIVWGNGSGGLGDLAIGNLTNVRVGHSDLGTVTGNLSGYVDLGGNISSNPLFVAPPSFNFELSVGSPAEKAAVCDETDLQTGNAVRVAPLIDFEGDPRPPSPTMTLLCDMGADQIDHCVDTVQDMDETGTDCGGSRCAPCGSCTAGPNHVQTMLVGYPGINDAYNAISTSGNYVMSAHRIEFSPGSAFTKTAGGQAINLRISGGYECDYTTRAAPNNHTTIHGPVVIGGDTVLEADHLGVR